MADPRRQARLEAVVAAARRHRDAMRRYMAGQEAMMARGVPLDELVAGNWDAYAEVAAAEEAMHDALDSLDSLDGTADTRNTGTG